MISLLRSRILLVAALGTFAALGSGPAPAEDKVMARVNGKEITESDLVLAEADLGSELGNLPPAVKRRVLVEYMIETRLFAEAAEGAALSSGADFERRMAYWHQRALRDAFFDTRIKGAIGEGAAKSVYDEKVKLLPPEEEVQARHILVDSEEQAKALAAKIAAGGDFAQLAKESSQDPGTKDQGGLLGYFTRGQMVPQFEEVAFTLKPGEVSKPVKSQFGWHLIKLEDRRQRPPPAFEEVKDRIVGSMVQSKAQEIAGQLRGKASIEYVDAEVKRQAEEAAAQRRELDQQMKEQVGKADAQRK
jgi:peptidyl-prolyl cis-trans isomerase C